MSVKLVLDILSTTLRQSQSCNKYLEGNKIIDNHHLKRILCKQAETRLTNANLKNPY